MVDELANWRGAGVAYRDGLENRCAFIGTGGSNPPLSVDRPCELGFGVRYTIMSADFC